MEKAYRNTGFFFLILIVFIILGFYYPYFSLFPRFPSVTTIIHIHAITLMIWTLILIVQPLLIRYKKYRMHRSLGKFTYFLLPLIIISSLGVMRQQYDEDIAAKMTSWQSLKALFTSFTGILAIIIYYSLAIVSILKGNAAFHMRYMICLFLEFIPPTFGRTLGYWFNMRQVYTHSIAVALGAVILILLIAIDKKKESDYTPYVVALALYFIFNVSWVLIGFPL